MTMRKGSSNPGRSTVRPVSWCIGGPATVTLPPHDPLEADDPRGDLARRGLARSTSYQALHSALARLYRIDDFHMDRIGAGFFSEVFKVRHRVTGDVMVLKMNKLISNRHNMLREVELMNRLHHPNILRYYGVCVNEGQVHALTEYINGGSLDSLIGNRALGLPWSRRVSLALDMSHGMAYLHSQGVFHRDLTSKNVLIKHTQEGSEHKVIAVIADFGLAAPIPHEKCMRLRQVGSPYWMAPEVIRGDWYDHRVDVFSFGIIVCEMIARCEADPDVLPRTHNFGVHYLDFYQMCQQDCPALFLQLAFMCCQIDPASRPSFEELKSKLEYLLNQLTFQSVCCTARKLKVCHRRSQSDETFKLLRNQAGEGSHTPNTPAQYTHLATPPNTGTTTITPQEIVEKMSAADPYFQPSTGTVNPFAQLKLPARSQLALQEGGRYCHSLPNYPLLIGETPSMESNKHIHTSDSCVLCHNRKHCQCLHSVKKFKVSDCKCKLTVSSEVDSSANSIPRSEVGSGGEVGTAMLNNTHISAPVRRRGSGESGFFSVGDVERIGTPELCLSYSELSTASLISAEDDDPNHHCFVQRSSSVITDSSEDLSSLGCCHDPHSCDLSSMCEGEDIIPTNYVDTDIRQIVDFFERNIGSSGSDGTHRQSSRLRQGCLVPLHTGHHRLAGITNFACHLHHNGTKSSSSSPYTTKDCAAPKLCRQPYSRVERRDIYRVKDRPKVYVTEGTVRAKRDIFEAK